MIALIYHYTDYRHYCDMFHLICHNNIIVLFIMIYDDIATRDVIYYILYCVS